MPNSLIKLLRRMVTALVLITLCIVVLIVRDRQALEQINSLRKDVERLETRPR